MTRRLLPLLVGFAVAALQVATAHATFASEALMGLPFLNVVTVAAVLLGLVGLYAFEGTRRIALAVLLVGTVAFAGGTLGERACLKAEGDGDWGVEYRTDPVTVYYGEDASWAPYNCEAHPTVPAVVGGLAASVLGAAVVAWESEPPLDRL